jgi:hypothetical protein
MAITTWLRSIFQFDSHDEILTVTVVLAGAFPDDKAFFRNSQSADVELEGGDKLLQPGELSSDEDTRGGLGKHLGLTSTAFLMYVFLFCKISSK